MRSKIKKAVIPSAVFVLLFLVLFYITYGYSLSLRVAAIINGRNVLKEAQMDLQKNGRLTEDYGHQNHVFLYTNNMAIGGTDYQCAIAVELE
jgi:hypothetical protein